jgi:dipeptidyl aminopeptidase/acylaminoacyl peptidase
MTTFDRFERSIPELMTELAPARVPDYFDDLLRQTATHRQRPAWSYPERWLPVDITARPLAMRSFPWRPLAILALIALLVAAGLVVYVGSQSRLPPPFGVAGNGVLVYRDADGAIVSVDPTTGSRATVIPASGSLGTPVASRDGRRIALVTFASTRSGRIFVAGIDGSDRIPLAGGYREVDAVDWSPDDTHLAIVSNVAGIQAITVAATDGSASTSLPLDGQVAQIAYLPDGRLAVMAADRQGFSCPGEDPTIAPCALFVVNADGTGLDRLIGAGDFHGINTITPAPDGTSILWVEWKTGAEGRLHLFDLATRTDRRIADDTFPVPYSINRAWFSPDGRSILFDLFEDAGNHWAVVQTAGGAPVRIGQQWPGNGTDAAWAPDGRSVIARYATGETTGELWLLDPTGGGADRRLDVEVPYLPNWQRIATAR